MKDPKSPASIKNSKSIGSVKNTDPEASSYNNNLQ